MEEKKEQREIKMEIGDQVGHGWEEIEREDVSYGKMEVKERDEEGREGQGLEGKK